MLTLYLACLISGAGLLAISLFTGGDGDADVDHSLDAHADLDHTLDAPADALHSIEAHGGGDAITIVGDAQPLPSDVGPAQHGELSSAFQFFSFRNIVYLTTFFGLTGSVLTLLGTAGVVTLLSSFGMGAFAMMVGHKFMRYLKESESGQSIHAREFIGHIATVTLPPARNRFGKIRLTVGAHTIEFTAVVHPECRTDEFRTGDRVLILDMEKNVACIDEAEFAGDGS
jgi:hypothetical protein